MDNLEMNYEHMLSENFQDLEQVALKEKTKYINKNMK